MSLISTWSTVANANGTLGSTPFYWPEGQAPSTVNDCARLLMATIRTQMNDAAWFNWGYTVTRVSGTSFSVVTAAASTVTLPAFFEATGRIKILDTSTMYGTITTVSASAASTLVTFTPDSGSLTASFSSVFNSILSPTNTAIPGLTIPTDVVTQKCPQIFAVDSGATNSAQITLSPVLSAYAAGQMINFQAAAPNTGAMTLQVSALGSKSIKNSAGSNLSSGDVVAGQIVTVVYNGTYFQLVSGAGGGGGGAGDAVISSITQATHGFSIGQVLYLNSGTYTLGNASAASTAEVIGIIQTVPTVNTFTMVTGGHITGLSGLTAGVVYFLSALTPGALTATPPTTTNYINKPLLVADSSTSGYFINYRGEVVSTQSSPRTQIKCWGYFTVAAGAYTLQNNYNTTSIAKTATGRITVTIDGDFSSANYCIATGVNGGGGNELYSVRYDTLAAGTFNLAYVDATGNYANPGAGSWMAAGDQ